MSWRVPPFDRAVSELEAYVRQTWRPLGVIVSGSIVRGEAGPTSDLDVCVVHAEPWRLREQRRFAGVPAELFVNPAVQVRRYFESEHAAGRPATAHMFATGEPLGPLHPVALALVTEAHEWLARPLSVTPGKLVQQRYTAVDLLDDARDVMASDPAAAALLLGQCVREIIAHAFWRAGRPQPRRKQAVGQLAVLDPEAAALVRRFAGTTGPRALELAAALARRVLGEDTFFAWTSSQDPVSDG
jgi:hypothetical protein